MEQSLSRGEVHWGAFSDNSREQTCVTCHKNLPWDVDAPGVVLCLEKAVGELKVPMEILHG